MTPSELEALIRLITTEVLKAFRAQSDATGVSQESSGGCCRQGNEDFSFKRKVLCASDLEQMESEGKSRLVLSPETIITPLAAELAREKQISLVYAEQHISTGHPAPGSGSVFIVSQSCSQSQLEAVIEAAAENGYSAQSEKAPGSTAGMVLKSAVRNAQRVSRGETDRLIVLDENVYPLSVQLKRIAGINPKICWDSETSAESRDFNVLLLNSRLLGIPILRRITKVWLQD